MRILKAICFADENFENSFKDYKKLIQTMIKFSNKRLNKLGIHLEHSLGKRVIKGKSYDEILDNIGLNKGDIIIYFTYQNHLKLSEYKTRRGKIKEVYPAGVADKNKIIISKFFPIRIPFLYKYGLNKLTLHEIGHMFQLEDTFFKKFSIMDNRWGVFTSRFNRSEKEKVKRYSKDLKMKIGCY